MDNAGNQEQPIKTEAYVIDADPPAISINTPADGSSAMPVYGIFGTASDLTGSVTLVELRITSDSFWYVGYDNSILTFIPGETWVAATGTDSWYLLTSLVPWMEGTTYTVTARATDTSGNTSSVTTTFIYGTSAQSSTISCSLSESSIISGEPLQITGQISPVPDEGSIVYATLTPASGPAVEISGIAATNGTYSLDVECDHIYKSGSWSVRTSWVGDTTYDGAVSQDQTLTVSKAESRVTLYATSQAIKLGDKVTISGKLTPEPDCGGDLSGIPISLSISGGDVQETKIVTTNQWGQFALEDYPGGNDTGLQALGNWTVQATFAGNDKYQSDLSDQLQISMLETAGYAIIVQGSISNNEGRASHNKTNKLVYKVLRERGLTDDDIKYFNYNYGQPPEQIKINGENALVIIDGLPTQDNIENAITTWARDKMIAMPANLYIVMVDHGLVDQFFIHPEVITSLELDGWLNDLQDDLSGTGAVDQEIIAILGFCKSGSFIDDISGPNRVIIASAAGSESSYKGPLDNDNIREGEYFVAEFFKQVSFGKSIRECFVQGVDLTDKFTKSLKGKRFTNAPFYDNSRQHPLIDDNGDGTGINRFSDADTDGDYSNDLFIGVSSVTGNDPGDVMITQTTGSLFLGESQSTADIWARVDDDTRLGTIWIEVKPSDYTPVDDGVSGQVTMDLSKTVTVQYDAGLERFEWNSHGGFTVPGTYQVFYFAKDDITGNVSPLMESRVYKARPGNIEPNPFSLVEPVDEASVRTTVMLDWTNTCDPNGDGFTYTVVLSKNDDSFSAPVYIEGLTDSSLLAGPEHGIADLATYYWKVWAVDEYGAKQESDIRWFYTNNTNDPNSFMQGYIRTASGAPIVGASISVGSFSAQSIVGGYYIIGVEPDTHSVSISKSGYDIISYSDSFATGGFITRNFELTPSTSKVASLTFSPEHEGSYSFVQHVEIGCATPGTDIHYTTDGNEPGQGDPIYSSPIIVSTTTTIKAMAVKAGLIDSDTATKDYTVNVVEGDVSGDSWVDLADVILVLQVISGAAPSSAVLTDADVNNDDKIGLEEVIYILQDISDLR